MSFDRLAHHYGWLERLLAGHVLQTARRAHLEYLRGCKRLLVLGNGPGLELVEALRVVPEADVTCVDASRRMLDVARRRTLRESDTGRIRWIHASLPGWLPNPDAGYDAVITSCFLDCFSAAELGRVIGGVDRACQPGARWLVIDFAVPAKGWRRTWARAVHKLMYATFRLVTHLPARRWTDPAPGLEALGWRCRASATWQHGLVRSDCWERVAPDSRLKAPPSTPEMPR